MRARIVLILFLAAITAGLPACTGAGDADAKVQIVAAFYPLAFAAEQVAGARAEVRNLTPPGTEPHDLELSPRDVATLRDADLVLYIGGFMPALDDAVHGEARAVDLADGKDPHVWLDPVRYAALVRRVARAVGRPAAGTPLVGELRQLDAAFARGLRRCARRTIVTSHAAFGPLAARYGLEQLALTGVSPEAEPGPRALARLIAEVRRRQATTVFVETLVSRRLSETVARASGADIAVLDPIESLSADRIDAGADYFTVMDENLAALRTALGCR